jgi:hypothetical protein
LILFRFSVELPFSGINRVESTNQLHNAYPYPAVHEGIKNDQPYVFTMKMITVCRNVGQVFIFGADYFRKFYIELQPRKPRRIKITPLYDVERVANVLGRYGPDTCVGQVEAK